MDSPEDLASLCAIALAVGLDFGTIWRSILRVHPLVASRLIWAPGRRSSAVVPLITGHSLVIDPAGEVRLRWTGSPVTSNETEPVIAREAARALHVGEPSRRTVPRV